MNLPIQLEWFLRYDIVRAHGYFNMITEANEAMRYSGLKESEYKFVIRNYDSLKVRSDKWRAKSSENEALYTEQATAMATRVREMYQKELKIKKEVEEIMERALSEPAPF